MKFSELNPCDYENRKKQYSTLREQWEDASRSDLLWLIGKAHSVGNMPRKRLVEITLNVIEPFIQSAPRESKECIAELRRWIAGDEVDLLEVKIKAAKASNANANANAAAAAYAAAASNAASNYAYAAYAATNAANAATNAATTAAYYAAYANAANAAAANAYAYADIKKRIHEVVTLDEICSYLDINPEEI